VNSGSEDADDSAQNEIDQSGLNDSGMSEKSTLLQEEEGWSTIIFDSSYKISEDIDEMPLAFIPKTNDINNQTRFKTDIELSKSVNQMLIKICSSVYHLLNQPLLPEQRENTQLYSTLFKQTVKEVFHITRVMSFS
jgi:hypothetical protein